MDHHQSNLMIEDTLRVEITRNIGITNRAVGICAGSNPVTEWEHIVDCIHNPLMYRLSLIKFFYFEFQPQYGHEDIPDHVHIPFMKEVISQMVESNKSRNDLPKTLSV